MSINEIIFLAIAVVLGFMVAGVLVQLYFVLQEFRQTITKANKVLDDTGVISESVSKPVSMISSMVTGVKGWSSIMKILTKDKHKKD